ncbi:hypothetical protein ASD54_01540 [Rhizobium sp. Root149]|nr:hypothetical protein ASD54_01540 [Rhizobium sp. Root149]
MEPTASAAVIGPATVRKEIMMMQQPAPVQPAVTTPKQQIPQHLVDRLESEWRQMRETASAPVISIPVKR